MARRISNKGKLYVRCSEKRTRMSIPFKFDLDQLIFTVSNKKIGIKSDGVNLFCTKNSGKKGAGVILCDNYGEALSHIIEVEQEAVFQGQLDIRDIPFNIFVLSSGFMLQLDLGEVNRSFAITIKDRQIMVARGSNSPLDVKQPDPSLTEMCEDFHEALGYIYRYAKEFIQETIGEPDSLH